MDSKKQLKKNRLSQLLLSQEGKYKSQTEFAEDLGVSQYTLNCWLNRKHYPGAESLKKIADYMDTTLDKLYEYLEDDKSSKENTALSLIPYIDRLSREEKIKLLKIIVDKIQLDN